MNLSSALEYSSQPPVSVYGTGRTYLAFLGDDTLDYRRGRSLAVLSPTLTKVQRAIPSARTNSSSPSLLAVCAGSGILTACPSTIPFGFALGPD